MITLTPREALEIQTKQIEHYSRWYPQLIRAAKQATKLEGLNLDTPYPSKDLALRIPRGAYLGYLIGKEF